MEIDIFKGVRINPNEIYVLTVPENHDIIEYEGKVIGQQNENMILTEVTEYHISSIEKIVYSRCRQKFIPLSQIKEFKPKNSKEPCQEPSVKD